MKINPVILSGGSGTRLWPLSREQYPKQLLSLLGERTLLQQTVTRLEGMAAVADPLLVCNEEHRFLIAEQMRQLGKTPADIILEPVGRNTAPALAIAALKATADGQDPILMAMPADHVISDEAEFRRVVAAAVGLAEQGVVVTFGIVPSAPETGYGYIRKGAARDNGAFVLQAFVEKPDLATAEGYLTSGDYLWNSNIFMLRASLWLELLQRHRPDIAAACHAAVADGGVDGDFFRVAKPAFVACPSDSIDYAVMEKLSGGGAAGGAEALVLPLDAGWSDLGAWAALLDVRERDANGNVTEGYVLTHDAHDNLLLGQNRILAAVGVDHLVVVETADAVLVADRDRAQDVKMITEALKAAGRSEHRFHRRVHRPWGSYEGVDEGDRFQVKRLTVNPGAALSAQMHHHRAEHWIVVKGTARVTREGESFLLGENQSTYIPMGATHRLENPGTISLELIEVQSGSYLGEDDIVRFEDRYNRLDDD